MKLCIIDMLLVMCSDKRCIGVQLDRYFSASLISVVSGLCCSEVMVELMVEPMV